MTDRPASGSLYVFASRYVLTLDFERSNGTRWRGAERFIYADSDREAVTKAHEIMDRETAERRAGWSPVRDTARLVSVVTLTEPVEMELTCVR